MTGPFAERLMFACADCGEPRVASKWETYGGHSRLRCYACGSIALNPSSEARESMAQGNAVRAKRKGLMGDFTRQSSGGVRSQLPPEE